MTYKIIDYVMVKFLRWLNKFYKGHFCSRFYMKQLKILTIHNTEKRNCERKK